MALQQSAKPVVATIPSVGESCCAGCSRPGLRFGPASGPGFDPGPDSYPHSYPHRPIELVMEVEGHLLETYLGYSRIHIPPKDRLFHRSKDIDTSWWCLYLRPLE